MNAVCHIGGTASNSSVVINGFVEPCLRSDAFVSHVRAVIIPFFDSDLTAVPGECFVQPLMARRLVQWQNGLCPPPWELMICPTHRCNLKCGICARSWEERLHPTLLDEVPDDRWLQLVDEAAASGVRYLSIGGGGEPTLRRELIMKICAKTKGHGLEGHLQTNGTLLCADDVDALIALGWDHVTISLDGPTASVNDAVRFKNAFNESVKRIDMLYAAKKRKRASAPDIQVHMVLTALNCDQLSAMADFCAEHGVESLFVSPLLEYSSDMKSFILSPQQRAELPGHVQRAIAKANALGLVHNFENLLSASELQPSAVIGNDEIAGQWPVGHIAGVRCLEPWRGLVVSSSGHALPCCYFWEEKADSIRNKSLPEVWLGSYMTAFREKMRSGTLPEPCRSCGFPDSLTHRKLKACVQQAASSPGGMSPGRRSLVAKAWNSLRNHGLRGSVQRYRQWRAIRRALRNEP